LSILCSIYWKNRDLAIFFEVSLETFFETVSKLDESVMAGVGRSSGEIICCLSLSSPELPVWRRTLGSSSSSSLLIPTMFSSVVVHLLQSQLPMWHTDALVLFSHDAINAETHTISFINEFLFNNRVLNTFIILILSLLIQINFFFILNFLIHLGDHLFVVLHLMFTPICLSLVSLISQIHL
jgi:hypothetical protein